MRNKVKITESVRTAKLMIVIIMLLTATIAGSGCGIGVQEQTGEDSGGDIATAKELTEGDTAPDFSVNLLTGDTFKLSEHRGKVVFLNFWATWCSPCVAEMPDIQELSEKYKEDVVFIGMDFSEEQEKVKAFIEDGGYTYSIGIDENGSIAGLYPSNFIPYTLIIDEEGIITKIFVGSRTQSEFEEAIKEALN